MHKPLLAGKSLEEHRQRAHQVAAKGRLDLMLEEVFSLLSLRDTPSKASAYDLGDFCGGDGSANDDHGSPTRTHTVVQNMAVEAAKMYRSVWNYDNSRTQGIQVLRWVGQQPGGQASFPAYTGNEHTDALHFAPELLDCPALLDCPVYVTEEAAIAPFTILHITGRPEHVWADGIVSCQSTMCPEGATAEWCPEGATDKWKDLAQAESCVLHMLSAAYIGCKTAYR